MMDYREKETLKQMLYDAIEPVLEKADRAEINHPYWNHKTAGLMADAACLIVLAADLPKLATTKKQVDEIRNRYIKAGDA